MSLCWMEVEPAKLELDDEPAELAAEEVGAVELGAEELGAVELRVGKLGALEPAVFPSVVPPLSGLITEL